jgi:AcrR family transcriptional regulator
MTALADSSPVRTAIIGAFRELVQDVRYEDLTIGQIVARAGVARSSFYQHFSNKDELLLVGLSEPFEALSNAVDPNAAEGDLVAVVEHIWENRRIGRPLLSGPMRMAAHQLLVSLVEKRLANAIGSSTARPPLRLIAHRIAGGQLALLLAWISSEAPSSASLVATEIRHLSISAREC